METVYLYRRVPKDPVSRKQIEEELAEATEDLIKMFQCAHPFEELVWFLKELKSMKYGEWKHTIRKDSLLLDVFPWGGKHKLDRITFYITQNRHPRDNPSHSRSKYRRTREHCTMELSIVEYDTVVNGRHVLTVTGG